MQPMVPPLLPPRPGSPAPETQRASAVDPTDRPTREAKAVWAFTLGVLGIAGTACGMGLSLGIPAIVIGALAHRDIRRSGGASTGGALATAGIILGSIGSTVFLGWMGILAWSVLSPNASMALRLPFAAARPTTTVEGPSDRGSPTRIVDLHPSAGALRAQLASQASSATNAGEDVLVETLATSCDPCVQIQRAMSDPTVRAALTKVRLLRVDVTEFRAELAGLRMNEPTVPWFYLLDRRGQPMDAISADEWDDNDGDDIAPILAAFVHGNLQPRRTSWRGRTSL